VLLAAAAAGAPRHAGAQAAVIAFHMAAGPATATIAEFARQADIRILANANHLAGVRTGAVQGTYPLRQALDILLARTGLVAQVNTNGSILIERAPAAAPAPPPAHTAPAAPAAPDRILIVGTRASERDAIARKRDADTARDAVVAEDVGTFPDRNVAEAISRIAGVALERGIYGEGTTISVRANVPEYVRVEIDGLGVQAAGGTDLNFGGSGRGVDLRELSTDLIKSIDVVKGSTVDMTEGSLGGSVVIRTRTGLDFDKRYLAFRLARQANTINNRRTPNLNLTYADRFLDRRLGVVLNLTRSDARNESHAALISDIDQGASRAVDFDGASEKTVSYNPATVSTQDPAATAPLARWAKTGGGTFDSLSPLDVVTRSAAAQSKADCYAAFPFYASADLAAISQSANRAAAQRQRADELLSCLNQWNDYTPQHLRYLIRREYDQRLYGDLRVDFKVDARLSLYAKVNRNTRRIDDDQLFLSLANLLVNTDGRYADSGASPNIVRTPLSNSGYYLYPTPVNLGAGGSTYRGLTNGSVVNVAPSSVTVDANHHVTRYTVGNAGIFNDQIYDRIESESLYAQVGGTWRAGGLRAEFLAGRATSEAWRMQWRTGLGFNYGPATVSVAPSGVWTVAVAPGAYDQANLNNYGVLNAPAGPGLPALSSSTALTMANPRVMERFENTARVDATYAFPGAALPWLERLKFGASMRDYGLTGWTGPGVTVQAATATAPAIVVPRVSVRGSITACENTLGSLASNGRPCAYGTSFSGDRSTVFDSAIVVPQAAYRAILGQVLTRTTAPYFNSAPGMPAGLVPGWLETDVRRMIALTGVRNFNLDCIKTCMGSDGKVYEQPKSAVREQVAAGYLSTDFRIDRLPFAAHPLPYGWSIDGNLGWRLVHTRVAGTGLMTFQSTTTTADYDPAQPDAPGGVNQATLSRNTTVKRGTLDVMPVLNLAWWPVKDTVALRYNRAKTIARPPVQYLYSNNVVCTYDDRQPAGALGGADATTGLSCDGAMGNPALRPMTSWNDNLSFEWYRSRDTLVSGALFRQHGTVGQPLQALVTDTPFAESGLTDPASGADLSRVRYTYTTWVNGPGLDRSGFELGAKTAFTFLPASLPAFLRHFGLDANYTRTRTNSAGAPIRDLLTGAVLGPTREQSTTWNASLWYDDGKLRARIALQGAAGYFLGLAGGVNNYPAAGVTNYPALPFNPGSSILVNPTRYLDAKVSYQLGHGVELFAEGRNLGRTATSTAQGGIAPFANGAPTLIDYSYAGAQYMLGLNVRY
jgi:TonB-dependent receptor